jgi:hypothetical protein
MTIDRLCLSNYLGDCVSYRNLEPPDMRLQGLAAIRAELGLPERKKEKHYA